MTLTSRQIQIILSLAETSSALLSAQLLHTSPENIVANLRTAERKLGFRIFNRTPLTPDYSQTEAGSRLISQLLCPPKPATMPT